MSNNIQDVTGLKLCQECGRLLPLTSFGKCNKYRDGLYPKCKECANRLQREYRDANREHVRQQAREYYAENREHLRQCQNEWRDENREHVRQQKRDWYDKNREHVKQQRSEWHADRYQNDPIFLRKKIVRDMTNRAVYRGELTRPAECPECGSSEFIIEAHHASYEPGDELNVTWLCPSCHRKLHRNNDD